MTAKNDRNGTRQRSGNPAGTPPAVSLDLSEVEAFRATIPDYRRFEHYQFLFLKWDIVKAQYILNKYPRDLGYVNVAQTAQALGFPFVPAGTEPRPPVPDDSGFYYVNTKTVMDDNIDLERPIIVACIMLPNMDEEVATVIDGLARIFKAAQLGREKLPCYALSLEEEQACRIP